MTALDARRAAVAVLVGSCVYVSVLYLTLVVPWLVTHYLVTHPLKWGQVGKVLLDNVPASAALLASLFLSSKELRVDAFSECMITVSGIASALAVLNHNHAVLGTFRWQYAAVAVWSLTAGVSSWLADVPTAIAVTAIASIMYEGFWVPVAFTHFTEPKGWASLGVLALRPTAKGALWFAAGIIMSWAAWPLITRTPAYPLVRLPAALGAVMYAKEVGTCP